MSFLDRSEVAFFIFTILAINKFLIKLLSLAFLREVSVISNVPPFTKGNIKFTMALFNPDFGQ